MKYLRVYIMLAVVLGMIAIAFLSSQGNPTNSPHADFQATICVVNGTGCIPKGQSVVWLGTIPSSPPNSTATK